MAVLKCKMCGGDLAVTAGVTVAECDFCGTKQTLPKVSDEGLRTLFNRANNLRIKCEFDKAEQIYEKILQQNENEAEAHWGIVLCKYGIEYVEDPKTFKRIPTCHRTSYDAVTADGEYLAALACADEERKAIYEAEAKAIDKLQKDILTIVRSEKPFDVFICYKETDENGKRTPDSVIANDIYHQLTQEGLKVFYAAITLEDKLGQEYEPYIFAALSSAKVMLAVGTKPEHFSAVWVKNEWSRFLKLMKSDRSKLLIPCYKDMDAYDLPEEFAHLQAQDMSKIGFINDVVRGIRKLTIKEEPKAAVVKETVITKESSNTAPLLQRAFMFLEDGKWDAADEYCEKVLDQEPQNARAYLGKLMAELRVRTQPELKNCPQPFNNNENYQKVIRFADEKLKVIMEGHIDHINTRNETSRLAGIYENARSKMALATEGAYLEATRLFETIPQYMDATALAAECTEKAEIARKDAILREGYRSMSKPSAGISDYKAAIIDFQKISGWKDADDRARICMQKVDELKAKAKAKAKRNKIIGIMAVSVFCALIVFAIVFIRVIMPAIDYSRAGSLMEAGDLSAAAITFGKLDNYRDSKTQSAVLWNKAAVRETISAGQSHTVGLNADGTVVAAGANVHGQCNVSDWTDIVAVSASAFHTVGLKADGTVVAVGSNTYGQCDVAHWTDIVAISADELHTVGQKADGTVVAVGANVHGQCNVSDWTDIVAVSTGAFHTVGLKADGTVVAAGKNYRGECEVSDWTDIVAISAGAHHTVGLKADGTVVAAGEDIDGWSDVSNWTGIVAIGAGRRHTVGLKTDGTIEAAGNNKYGQTEVFELTDIVAISAGYYHTVCLIEDGTVVVVGRNDDGQCNVSDWTNIKLPE